MPRVLGASVTGPAHSAIGRGCEDRFACAPSRAGGLVIALADGLGSASRSADGADAAVSAACGAGAAMLAHPCEPTLARVARTMITHARAALDTAADENTELRDFACTLIAIAVRDATACVAHIGDGAVVARASDEYVLLSGPGPSEYANEVVPLTAECWRESIRVSEVLDGVEFVAAFTDGCQHAVLRPSGAEAPPVPHPGFLDPLLRFAREADATEAELAAVLGGSKMSEHSDDDKTLVLAVLGR